MPKIIAIVDKKGTPKLSVEGAAGDECLKLTKTIEEALGKVTKREMKETEKPTTVGENIKAG